MLVEETISSIGYITEWTFIGLQTVWIFFVNISDGLMMMYGEGPPPPTLREHHHHHHCWPLIWVAAIDFHYVIVLRVAIDYSL